MGTPRLPSVDSDTNQFPDAVREAQAANLRDTLTPEGAAVAEVIAAGGGGGADSGYDIVIAAGQSNMSGRGTPFSAMTDPVNPLIFQYGNSGTAKNTISPASEPLLMHDTPSGIGPALQFARWYSSRSLATGRKILIVPVAHGGTPLSSTATLGWRRGVSGNLYANMITQVQGALAAAGTGSRIVTALWLQGETDGDNGTTGTQYQTDFDALITGLRTDLGIADLPFVIGTMVPEYLSTGTRSQINAVHRDTPNRIARTDVAVSATASDLGDGNHFNAAGQRYNGRVMWEAYERISTGLLPYSEKPTAATTKVLGVTSAAQAYSLRKVADSTYTGKAVQVRRSSDNTTLDIGFVTNGDLDTAALLTFAGTGDACVATWYDQSGNGRHLTQTTAGYQPKIVSAGAIVTSGGKPAVSFDGSDDRLLVSSAPLYAAGAATVLQVMNAPTPAYPLRTWAESYATGSQQYGLIQPDAPDGRAFPVLTDVFTTTSITPAPTLTPFDGAVRQASAVDTGTAMSQWVDGVADGINGFTYTRPARSFDTFTLGGVTRTGTLAPKAMTLSELVTFPRALSTADRQTVATNQKGYYGTP